MKTLAYLTAATFLSATPAHAQSFEMLAEVTYAEYSDDMGDRTEGSVIASNDFGAATLVVEGKIGERSFPDQTFKGHALGADLYFDLNENISSRTYASFGSEDPVFTRRIIGQDIMVKAVSNLVLTAGISDREYYGNVDAMTYSGGPTFYFNRGFVKYTYTHYAIEGRNNTSSHLATVRYKDSSGKGYTQAWIGGGTSVQEYEFVVPSTKGDILGIAARRIQPISDRLALTLGADYQWFDTPLLEYQRWGLSGGLHMTL